MKTIPTTFALPLAALLASLFAAAPLSPIEVKGDEQRRVNLQLPDGALKPVVGVHNFQVFRACRGKPEVVTGGAEDRRTTADPGNIPGEAGQHR